MHTNSLIPIALLALPLLSSAIPQNPAPAPAPAPANPQPEPNQAQPQPQPQPTTTLSPEQRYAEFDARYASLASVVNTDPAYLALVSNVAAAGISTPVANAQEGSYIVSLRTATGPIPEPPYVTNLPPDQQSWIQDFHQQIVPAATTSASSAPASTSTNGILPPVASINGTQAVNGTQTAVDPNGNPVTAGAQPGNPTPQATATDPLAQPQPSATDAAANGTDPESGAMRLGEGKGGLLGMVGMGLAGVLGIMLML
ncbi:MAG: hypothetical protein Q9192_003219 [Flavoplaca navasiana]